MITPSPSRLSPKYRDKYKRSPTPAIQLRDKFVIRSYEVGGKDFIAAVEKWGCNERGDRLTFHNWHREYYELIGDFRVAETLASGASQIGKTIAHTLLLCYCLTEGGLNTLWAYDQLSSLNIQVPSNFRPVIRHWLKAKGIKLKRDEGTQNNQLYQVKGADAQFTYVSTSSPKESSDTAAAGGAVVGVSRDILFKEERSQYPPGAGDPLNRRLDAGRLPSRPIRELGTKGAGQGIEAEIETADYYFYPHFCCPNCGQESALKAKGCLLKPDGGKYLSESGRPKNWFHKDEKDAIASAYFGCPKCDDEIPLPNRTTACWFRCIKTGINLRSFLDSLPTRFPERRYKVAIDLSPLLRETVYKLAPEIIREGLQTVNTDDWQQQRLGESSETSSTNVTLDLLKIALVQTTPTRKPDFILAGVDQGRSEDWLWICAYHLPQNQDSLSNAEIMEQSIRQVLFAGDVTRSAIAEKLKQYGAEYGLIDNEPDRSSASDLCRVTCLEMADQCPGLNDAVKKGEVRDGGINYPCWKIRNEKFLKSVLTGFLMQRYCLPQEWERWVGMPSERSPLVHLVGPSYDPASGRWCRGKNNNDDLYYAAMFCEAAFHIYLPKHMTDDEWTIGGERKIYSTISRY